MHKVSERRQKGLLPLLMGMSQVRIPVWPSGHIAQLVEHLQLPLSIHSLGIKIPAALRWDTSVNGSDKLGTQDWFESSNRASGQPSQLSPGFKKFRRGAVMGYFT